jgi:hypothetical protein
MGWSPQLIRSMIVDTIILSDWNHRLKPDRWQTATAAKNMNDNLDWIVGIN